MKMLLFRSLPCLLNKGRVLAWNAAGVFTT
jgi:hypothetical protein